MGAVIEVKYFNTFWAKKTVCPDYNQGAIPSGIENTGNWTGLPFYSFDSTSESTRYMNFWTAPTAPKPEISNLSGDNDWFIEESRIKGGYNNTSTDYGVKAYLENKNFVARINDNKVIYSGLFNSDVNVNETNVFSEATNITFTSPPEFGSIQRLYASDTKLHIFQQNKVSRTLINKDAIYAANGQGTPVSTTTLVIGEINPYVGEYGISNNPESWAQFGNRQYFSDKNRNTILRLSNDGLTEISNYGMRDFFRDELAKVTNDIQVKDLTDTIDGIQPPWPYPTNGAVSPGEPYVFKNPPGGGTTPFVDAPVGSAILINGVETGCFVEEITDVSGEIRVEISDFIPFQFSAASTITFREYIKDNVIGAYDVYNDNYTISMQTIDGNYNTLVYDEQSKGWVTFYDYKPDHMASLFNNFFSVKGSGVWLHNVPSDVNLPFNVSRNSFYGADPVPSSIEFIFNKDPSLVKNFKTINYEGSNGWEVVKMESDQTGSLFSSAGGWSTYTDDINTVKSYSEGEYVENGVIYRAGFYIKENKYVANIVNNSAGRIGEVLTGGQTSGIKGYYTTVKIQTDATTDPGQMKELFMVGSEFVPSSY